MFLKKIIDLIFYSNLWIALCAAAMCAQTQFILTKQLELNWLLGLVFFSTLFIYALHRIIGISKVSEFRNMERYAIIEKFKHHISFYALLSGIGVAVCFLKLSFTIQLSLIIPGLISIGYVLPFLSGKKRLRDLNHIKIFLIAIVWSWVTVFLPALELGQANSEYIYLMILERAIFIFAITLPFDIRDLKVDSHSQVKTIPAVIGVQKTMLLGTISLGIVFILCLLNWYFEGYDLKILIGMLFSIASTWILLEQSSKIKHDYFFTGLVDGTMIFQFVFVVGMYFLF